MYSVYMMLQYVWNIGGRKELNVLLELITGGDNHKPAQVLLLS